MFFSVIFVGTSPSHNPFSVNFKLQPNWAKAISNSGIVLRVLKSKKHMEEEEEAADLGQNIEISGITHWL